MSEPSRKPAAPEDLEVHVEVWRLGIAFPGRALRLSDGGMHVRFTNGHTPPLVRYDLVRARLCAPGGDSTPMVDGFVANFRTDEYGAWCHLRLIPLADPQGQAAREAMLRRLFA